MKNFLLIFIMLWILLKCSHHHHHGDANEHMNQTSFEDLTSSFENPERDKWQKPKEVLAFLEKESSKKSLKGLSVADLGAGTGYFSIRLLDAGA
ncbi:MAG TPA: hypothetical protein PKH22_14605, partial [Leptospiraceae bacterium]|nr:hypothetical protein [Leptospiraceae bacterium]